MTEEKKGVELSRAEATDLLFALAGVVVLIVDRLPRDPETDAMKMALVQVMKPIRREVERVERMRS
jgi:hypothetical protein